MNHRQFSQKQQNTDWQKAEKHAKSTFVGKPIHDGSLPTNKDKYCECCGRIVEKQMIPFCQNTKELQFLGIGFPLFFVFLKYCIILMFLQSLCASLISLYLAISNNYDFCVNNQPKTVPNINKQVHCDSYYIYLADVSESLSQQTIIIRIVDFLITISFFIFMRDKLITLIGYYGQRDITFGHYSILFKNLPKKDGLKQTIKGFLNAYEVHDIEIIASFTHIQKMQHQIQEKQKLKSKLLQQIQNNQSCIGLELEEFQESDLQRLQHKFLQALIEQQKSYALDEIIPQNIIVLFQTNKQKNQALQQMQKRQQSLMPAEWSLQQFKNMQVIQCPQPREIIWKNLSMPDKVKYKNRTVGWLITCVMLALISTAFYFGVLKIDSFIEHETQSDHSVQAYAIFYLLQLFIICTNKFLLSPILHLISHYEGYFTQTSQQYSFFLKYLLSMFFTSALMTVLVEAVTYKNIYSLPFGVIDAQSVMIIFNCFLIPLIWLINPWALYKKAKRSYYRTKKYTSQTQANQIMEEVQYTMGKRYAEIVKIVWLVSLYQSLIPMGYILATFGLGLYYWVDKFNLLRRSSVNQQISGQLTLSIMSLLQFALVLESFGDLFFDIQIRYQHSVTSYILLIISVIYIILPKNYIVQCCHGEKFHIIDKRLSDCIKDLGSSYKNLHPITGKRMRRMIKKITKKYKQPNNEQNMHIESSNLLQAQNKKKQFLPPIKLLKVTTMELVEVQD